MQHSIPLVAAILGILSAAALAAPGLTTKWEMTLDRLGQIPCFYPSAEAPDSVVITAGSQVIRVAGSGKEVFRFDLAGQAGPAPGVADLDRDGTPEIVAGTSDGTIVALAGDGRELWRHGLGAPFQELKCVVLADVSGDGRPEVIAADDHGWVNCLDAAGRLMWRFKVDPYRASSPAVGDLDGDGSPELIYGTDNHRVVCISADGRLRWHYRVKRNFGRSLAMIVDLGSGPDVLIPSSSPPFGSSVYCLEGATGRLRWASPLFQQGYGALAIGDVNLDGQPEVICADKSSRVFAFNSQGERLWATHLGGAGIFLPPAIADVDGDGEVEIVAGVRQSRADGRNFFLLNPCGEVKGEYSLGGDQATAPAVADIDGDGVLEILTCSPASRALRCFTLGGKARKEAVQSACFRAASSFDGSHLTHRQTRPPRALSTPLGQLINWIERPRVGTNNMELRLPPSIPDDPLIEVSRVWRGQRDTGIFDLSQTREISVELMPGEQDVEVTLIDGTNGRRLLAEKRKLEVGAVDAADEVKEEVGLALAAARQQKRLQCLAESAKMDIPDVVGRREMVETADAYHETLRRADALKRFKSSLHAAGWTAPFAAWQDGNPWDDAEPMADLPAKAQAEPTVQVWALGNEHEHAALNIVPLGGAPLDIRATVSGLEGHVEMLRPVWLPTKWGTSVPDLLPGFKSAAVLQVSPREPCQLWLHFDTKGLEPGVHEGTLSLTSLEPEASKLSVKVRLQVSPVALPDQPRTRVCCWRQVLPDGTGGFHDRVWGDLKSHGVTVVYGASPPTQKCDEKGDLVGEPDCSTFDDVTRRLVGEGAFLFFSGFGLSGPAKEWSPEWVKAMQVAAVRFDAHLQSLGIGNHRWAYYPVDEPCLVGGELVERFIRYARMIKEAAPNILVYADPAGAVTTDFLKRMAPYCDVWAPELSVLKKGPPEWLDIMKNNSVEVWCYEAPGDVRVLRPLGFYRMQPWVAARYGLDGSGYWVYSQDDLWGVGPDEPMYGAVQIEPDKSLTTTRRWEASRDGIEDSTLLHLFADAIEAAEAKGVDVSAARTLRQEALDTIAAAQDEVDAFTRLITDYEMDFEAVQRYRRRIAEAIISLRE